MAARIDRELCTACGACIEVCPVDAVTLGDGKAQVDVETCFACGVCEGECPTGAIRME